MAPDSPQDLEIVSLLGGRPVYVEATPCPANLNERDYAISYSDAIKAIATPKQNEGPHARRSRYLHALQFKHEYSLVHSNVVGGNYDRLDEIVLPDGTLTRTWRGVEVAALANGRQSEHTDQLLATLASNKAMLSTTLVSGDQEASVRELLATSVSNFHLTQPEIEWTAIAYALYFPPQTSWVNRLGEEASFDDLANCLMDKPLATQSCGGVHVLFSLTYILQSHRKMHILSPEVAESLEGFLLMQVSEAERSQNSDGSWSGRWTSEGFDTPQTVKMLIPSTASNKLVVTGHLVEWFHSLPDDMKPSEATTRMAVLYLHALLSQVAINEVSQSFCPYSHAIHAVQQAVSGDR